MKPNIMRKTEDGQFLPREISIKISIPLVTNETYTLNYCSEPLLQTAEVTASVFSSEDGYTD
jgi:hypothetical protein